MDVIAFDEIESVLRRWVRTGTNEEEMTRLFMFIRDQNVLREAIKLTFYPQLSETQLVSYLNIYVKGIHIEENELSSGERQMLLACSMTNARIKNNKLLTIRYDLRHRRASYANKIAFYNEIMNYLIPRNRFSNVFIYYTCYHYQFKSFVMSVNDWSITNYIQRGMLYFTVYKTRTTANVRPRNMPHFKLVQIFDQEDRTILQYKRRRSQ